MASRRSTWHQHGSLSIVLHYDGTIIDVKRGCPMVALNAIIELLGANYNVRSDDRAVSFDA